jgi:large subunit ribosomal protein L1
MPGKHSKRFQTAVAEIDADRKYEPADAIEMVKKTASTKFNESIEIHLRTSADPRHADQQLRGVATLPAGLGKTVRVAVFAAGEGARLASQAGAEEVGSDDLIARVEGGFMDFDVAIATPDMMGKIGKLGRILGRKGLMPNPRTNTVVQESDIGGAVEEAKKGRVELRMDRTAIIHSLIGKASFDSSQLMDNLTAIIDVVNELRPAAIKGQFVKTAYLTSTMGPSVPLDLASTLTLTGE